MGRHGMYYSVRAIFCTVTRMNGRELSGPGSLAGTCSDGRATAPM